MFLLSSMVHRRRAECNSLTYYYFAVQYVTSRDITILYIILRIKQKTVHLVERGLTDCILLDQSNVQKRSASPRPTPTPTPTPPPSPPTRCPSHAPERRRVEQSYGSAGKGGGLWTRGHIPIPVRAPLFIAQCATCPPFHRRHSSSWPPSSLSSSSTTTAPSSPSP